MGPFWCFGTPQGCSGSLPELLWVCPCFRDCPWDELGPSWHCEDIPGIFGSLLVPPCIPTGTKGTPDPS